MSGSVVGAQLTV